MVTRTTLSSRLTSAVLYLIVAVIAFLSLLPVINALAISLSSSAAASAEKVYLWPVDFTLASYQQIVNDPDFLQAFKVSVIRIVVGGVFCVGLAVLMAFPLAHDVSHFRARNRYMWFVVACYVFPPTLIPFYFMVKYTGLLNTIWALTVPMFVFQLFNVLILMNYFRGLPAEMEEAARIDGAGPWNVLFHIYVPLSIPCLATISLFTTVGLWNDWFWGAVFENLPSNWPLQTYIQSLNFAMLSPAQLASADPQTIAHLMKISSATFTDAKIVVALIPLVLVYPFLQRYFVKGLVLGAVKG
jgi:putative aldouronate transport system permease protein